LFFLLNRRNGFFPIAFICGITWGRIVFFHWLVEIFHGLIVLNSQVGFILGLDNALCKVHWVVPWNVLVADDV